jgi:hypothetical protein
VECFADHQARSAGRAQPAHDGESKSSRSSASQDIHLGRQTQRKTQLLHVLTPISAGTAWQSDDRLHHEMSSRRTTVAPGKFFRIIVSKVSDFSTLSVVDTAFFESPEKFFPGVRLISPDRTFHELRSGGMME